MQTLQPSNPLSDRNLSFGYWLATHRETLRAFYTVLWGIVAAVMLLLALLQSVRWFTHRAETEQFLLGLSQTPIDFASIQAPVPLTTRKAIAVFRTDTTIDAMIDMINTNPQWAALDMEYEVQVGGKATGVEHVAFAPGQEKFLTKMQIPYTGTSLPPVQVQVLKTQWKKIPNPTETLPTISWAYADVTLRSINTEELKTELSFAVKNNSVFGYREPQVVALLVDEDSTIYGIGSVTINEIASLESKPVTFVWPQRLPTGLQAQIVVNVDHVLEDRIIRE